MSQGSSFDTKERIRQAVDIVDLVGDYLQLQRDGRGYKALCPWHDDSRPSLKINPERQTFKCWVCDLGGDIFSFVMRLEGVEFPEALRMLAERARIPLDEPRKAAAGSGGAVDRTALYRVMAWAEQQYHDLLLRGPEAEAARSYAKGRQISRQSVERFHIGYAPPAWDWLLKRAQQTSYPLAALEKVGLIQRKRSGNGYYDRFRDRLLFPIRDLMSRPVGFGGRILPGNSSDDAPKYLNTSETPIFNKSKLLYGMDAARQAIVRSGTAVIVEGYTDCVAAHQAGIENVVAVLGTALGAEHLRTLHGLARRVVLVLDGDEAGRRRANEILELFVGAELDLRVLTLPEGVDPCDFVLEHGAEEFQRLLDGAIDALEHKFRVETEAIEFRSSETHEVTRAVEAVLATLAKAPRLQNTSTAASRLREEQMLQRMSHRFGVSEATLRERLGELRNTHERHRRIDAQRKEEAAGKRPAKVELDPWEAELLEIVLQKPDAVARVRASIDVGQFKPGPCQRVLRRCCELDERGEAATFDRLMLEFGQPEVQNLLIELDERGAAKGPEALETALGELIDRFRWRQQSDEHRRHTALVREGSITGPESLGVLAEMIQRERRRHGLED